MKKNKPVLVIGDTHCPAMLDGYIPFLKKIHSQWQQGEEPHLPVSPESYAVRREKYRQKSHRDGVAEEAH